MNLSRAKRRWKADVRVENDAHADCVCWRLTPIECVAHHGRLARHYAELATRKADEAIRLGNIAIKLQVAAVAFAVLALVLRVIV